MSSELVTKCDAPSCGKVIEDKDAKVTLEVAHEGGEDAYRYDREVWHFHVGCCPPKVTEIELALKAGAMPVTAEEAA